MFAAHSWVARRFAAHYGGFLIGNAFEVSYKGAISPLWNSLLLRKWHRLWIKKAWQAAGQPGNPYQITQHTNLYLPYLMTNELSSLFIYIISINPSYPLEDYRNKLVSLFYIIYTYISHYLFIPMNLYFEYYLFEVCRKKIQRNGRWGGTRTHNPLLRRQMLYPIELLTLKDIANNCAEEDSQCCY